MNEFKSIIKDLILGRRPLNDFFLLICPLVDETNVHEVCTAVPANKMLEFRRLVAYQKSTGRIAEIGENEEPRFIDDQFLSGLRCLREYFLASGTLQFGDYLLMERERIRAILQGLKTGGEHIDTTTISGFSDQLRQIEMLMEAYEPEVLSQLIVTE